ncbi:MAG: DUF1049 domain-containing protein [Halobacteria archaeon]|nr:DUF1049 domain-containing protein [Halobacteria archaeon]
MNYKMIITLFMLLLVVIFTVQNAAVVSVNLLFWKLEISRALLIFFVLIIGIIIGWISRSHLKHSKNKR